MDVSIRYIVDDTAAATQFYHLLGFEVVTQSGSGFAMLRRDALRLLLNTPGGGGGAGQNVDGDTPAPGGWNRFQLLVDDIDAEFDRLSVHGVKFRSAVIDGQGGRQVLAEDPSGNPVELFQPA